MSLANAPSKDEMMRWDTQTLADYMRQLNLSSCDKVVLQSSITGKQFMHMTQSQLQVFPSLYLPLLTNMQREINTGVQKKTFSLKSNTQTSKKVSKQDEKVWKSDEFSSGSDHDYEYPEEKTGEENYISPVFEPQTAEERGRSENDDENNSVPEVSLKPTRFLTGQDCPREKSSKTAHPHRAHIKPSRRRPLNSPSETQYADLHKDKTKKSVRSCPSQRTFSQAKGSTAIASGSSVSHFPQPRAPLPTDVFKRSFKIPPVPPKPTQPVKSNKATPDPKKCLDPSWYRGNVTRHEAEAALRRVNKDGAFIVRDSSQSSAEHPHTLMLLHQGKVYNIRIRRQGNSYLLGNGLNSTQSFPGVTEVIIHHMNTPLLLINATDQTSAEKPQCCLLHPAGL